MSPVRVSVHAIELTPLECEVLSELMTAKLEQHIAERAKYVRAQDSGHVQKAHGKQEGAGNPSPAKPAFSFDATCADCNALWFIDHERRSCATHRRACESCGRDDVPLHSGELSKKLGENGAELWEMWCSHCDPVVVGEKFADPEADPWDLASEELVLTRELPRDERRGWSGDRSEYDPFDDKSDIEARSRTEKA